MSTSPTADLRQWIRPAAASRCLIVLDIMLPGFDGIEACRQIRQFSDAYIIMLTARDEEMDKVLGLSMGADDYLVKPFSPRELIARVRAMLRRPRTSLDKLTRPSSTPWGKLTMDAQGRSLTRAGTEVDLTRTEFDLLAVMMAHPEGRADPKADDRCRVGPWLVRRRACRRRPHWARAGEDRRCRCRAAVHPNGEWRGIRHGRPMKRRPRLAVRLMQAQALVVGIGTLTLVVSAVLVAPRTVPRPPHSRRSR